MLLGLYARLQNAWDALRMRAREEGGVDSVEYGLAIAAVIAAGVIVVALIVA
jgi:Flp pilus assembly pilin Flp